MPLGHVLRCGTLHAVEQAACGVSQEVLHEIGGQCLPAPVPFSRLDHQPRISLQDS